MAGLPWYAIWSEFSRHGKTRDLCARVKDRNAGMYVIRIFEHCADQALDGRIAVHIVEEVAAWRGKDGALLAALDAAKILDVEGDTRIVHGWVERNGARIQKWLADKAKPRGNRKNPPAVPRGTDAGPEVDDGGTDAGTSGVDVRGKTEKKQKKPARLQRAARADEPESPAPETPAKPDPVEANTGSGEGAAPQRPDGEEAPGAADRRDTVLAGRGAPEASDPEPGQGESPMCPVTPASSRGARSEAPAGPPPDGVAAAMAGAPEPGYVPEGYRKRAPPLDDDAAPARTLLVVDEVELPPTAAYVRAELERQLGYVLERAGADAFALQVERLGSAEALRVCVQEAAQYVRRTGERIGSLAWFAVQMERFLGGPPTLGAPPPMPAPDPAWLASLPDDLRAKAMMQWGLAEDRVRRAVWADRRRDVLEQELAGLVTRIDAMRQPEPVPEMPATQAEGRA